MQRPHRSSHAWWPAIALLAVGTAGVAAAWTLLALMLHRQCAWMALVAAVDAIFLLRFARIRPGALAAALAVAATALAIALANWWIAAAQLAASVGMPPWEGILRTGARHAWIVADLANGPAQLAWSAFALLVAMLGAGLGIGNGARPPASPSGGA